MHGDSLGISGTETSKDIECDEFGNPIQAVSVDTNKIGTWNATHPSNEFENR